MYADVLGNLALMSAASLLSMPLSFLFLAIAPKMAKKFGLEGYIRHGLMIGTVMYAALFAMHLVMPRRFLLNNYYFSSAKTVPYRLLVSIKVIC